MGGVDATRGRSAGLTSAEAIPPTAPVTPCPPRGQHEAQNLSPVGFDPHRCVSCTVTLSTQDAIPTKKITLRLEPRLLKESYRLPGLPLSGRLAFSWFFSLSPRQLAFLAPRHTWPSVSAC